MQNEKPDTAEQYAVATNTSNLRMEMDADRRSNADILIAAAWAPSRIGTALMRLQTKVDTAGLEKVQLQTAMHAAHLGMQNPDAVACAVVGWWLVKVCPACHGRKFAVIPNTPSLSTKQCKRCRGTGQTSIPWGDDGYRLANWLDDCRQRAVASMRTRLQSTRNGNLQTGAKGG
jgi:hypothetical protein